MQDKIIRADKRKSRIRAKVIGTKRPRLSVHRSNVHMYAQIIDDMKQQTVVSCSSLEMPDLKGDKSAVAYAIGIELAKRAKEKGVDAVVFDRGRFKFHGRVKALADGLREGTLKF